MLRCVVAEKTSRCPQLSRPELPLSGNTPRATLHGNGMPWGGSLLQIFSGPPCAKILLNDLKSAVHYRVSKHGGFPILSFRHARRCKDYDK